MSKGILTAVATGSLLALSGSVNANLINEFEPNPIGTDPATTSVELLGTPNANFSGWILTVDTDFSPANTIDSANVVSGTYDANGLLTVIVPDFENPSFTILLVDAFTGSLGNILDDPSDLPGLGISIVYDAINTPDAVGDEAFGIAGALGGTDLVYSGDEPKLIFRDSLNPSVIYSINDPAGTDAVDQDGNLVPLAQFNIDPEISTFGAANPTAIPEPASLALMGLGVLAMARRR